MVRTKSLISLTCVAVAAIALGGCGTAKDVDKSARSTPKSSDAPGTHTHVEVQDAGAEPRQTLRFTLESGATQHATMTMRMGMKMTINGSDQPARTVPPMQMGMEVKIPEVDDDGNVTATFRYDRIKVLGTGATADQLKEGLAPLTKIKGTIRTTEFGELIDSDLTTPDGLDPTLKSLLDSIEQQLGNMMVPLPSEPVGVGATWTVHTEPAIGGIKAEVEYQYKLVERVGDRLVLQATYLQSVLEQDAHLPTMPAGATTHVYASQIKGSGRTVVNLGDLFPVDSTVETAGPMHMLVEQDDEQTDIVQRMHITMKMSD